MDGLSELARGFQLQRMGGVLASACQGTPSPINPPTLQGAVLRQILTKDAALRLVLSADRGSDFIY